MRLAAVGEHGPDLTSAGAGGFEDEVAAVRSPTGAFVAAGVAGDFEDVAGADVHDVDIVIAGRTAPGKGQKLSVGSPCRVHDVALVAQIEFLGVSAVGIHHVELWNAATVADEDDGLHGFGIPGGRRVGTGGGKGEALGTIAAGSLDIKRWIALHGRGEPDFRTVRRPCGRRVSASITSAGADFAR